MTNKLLRKMKDRAKANTQNMDFQKKKTKLGKKQASATSTKTTFQSQVLHMPSQSMIEDKGEMVTSRNLTLKDLLTQLSHYSETVRKDALIGLKEIVTKYPVLLVLHLGAILEKILNTITDGDSHVRQALVSLLEFIIPQFESETLSAYYPIIRVYLLAGLTHMYNTVRMTALSMVELWLNHFPEVIVPIADQLLPTYIVVLQSVATPSGLVAPASSKNSATKKPPPTSQEKQAVLNNLKKLLTALAQQHTSSGSTTPRNFKSGETTDKNKTEAPTLIWGNSQKKEIIMNQDYAIFLERQAAFFPQTYTTTSSQAEPSEPSATASAPSTPVSSASAPSTPSRSSVSAPATPATPSTPASVSAPSTPATPATSSTPTHPDTPTTPSPPSSSHTLLPTHEPADSWQFLRDFFKKLFPLLMANWVELITSSHAGRTPSAGKLDLPQLELMDTVLQILNLVLGLLGASGKVGKQSDIEKYMVTYFPVNYTSSEMTLDINVHLCNIFTHFLDSSVKSEQHELVVAMVKFTIQQFTDVAQVQAHSHKLIGLLPVLRKLLSCVGNTTAQQLLKAFTTFDENSHPHSAAKRACVEFLSEILQAHQSKTSLYKPSDKIASAGLLSFPKLLFKLSTHNPATTEAIFKALVLFGKSRSTIFEAVQLPLVPFFFTLLKPSAKHPKGARVFGPFVHLPASHQIQALDLLYFFPSLAPQMEKALLACCLHESVPAQTVSRAIQIFELHYARKRDASIEHYVAFLISLQVGLGQKLESSRAGAGTKRKRGDEDEDVVMEVEKDGKEVESGEKEGEK